MVFILYLMVFKLCKLAYFILFNKMEGKNCTKCFQFKSYDNYYKKSSSSDNHYHECKSCKKDYYQLNKEKIKIYQKEYWVNNKEKFAISNWKKGGIRSENFHELFEIYSKERNCYFCNIQFDDTKRNKKTLDHDHLSGYPRFIICHVCNIKLRVIDNKRKDVLLEIRRYHDRK